MTIGFLQLIKINDPIKHRSKFTVLSSEFYI
jgi:hypothetical protein